MMVKFMDTRRYCLILILKCYINLYRNSKSKNTKATCNTLRNSNRSKLFRTLGGLSEKLKTEKEEN